MNKPTTLTHAITDGELSHVVVVRGQPVQSHSTLKGAMAALLLAMALTGCETCQRHPVACGTGLVLLGGSLAASAHHSTNSMSHDVTTLPVSCANGACR